MAFLGSWDPYSWLTLKLFNLFQSCFILLVVCMLCSCACSGHKNIVEELLAAGALVDVRMGVPATTTPADLAREFEQHDILGILQSSANMPC